MNVPATQITDDQLASAFVSRLQAFLRGRSNVPLKLVILDSSTDGGTDAGHYQIRITIPKQGDDKDLQRLLSVFIGTISLPTGAKSDQNSSGPSEAQPTGLTSPNHQL